MNQQASEADLFKQQSSNSSERETKNSDAINSSKHDEDPPGGSGKLLEQKRQAEPYLSPFFELSLDLFCIAGLDGYFKHVNAAWTTCLGWTLDELSARPFEDFVHPDDRGSTRSEVGHLSEGEETILFENRYRHKDGSYRLLQWNALPISELGQVYATARDITPQRRLEREVLEILDQEKARLGRELHDGLCQTMAGIAALSATLSKKLSATDRRGPEHAPDSENSESEHQDDRIPPRTHQKQADHPFGHRARPTRHAMDRNRPNRLTRLILLYLFPFIAFHWLWDFPP